MNFDTYSNIPSTGFTESVYTRDALKVTSEATFTNTIIFDLNMDK